MTSGAARRTTSRPRSGSPSGAGCCWSRTAGERAGPSEVPRRALFEADVPVALGADDPLLFGPRLTAQYEIARHVHGFPDAELADLARTSVLSWVAPEPLRARLLAGIEGWLAGTP